MLFGLYGGIAHNSAASFMRCFMKGTFRVEWIDSETGEIRETVIENAIDAVDAGLMLMARGYENLFKIDSINVVRYTL